MAVAQVGGVDKTRVRRSLQRLVLRTWIAAERRLAAAAAEGLRRLSLRGAHEYAGTFELAAFDVIFDAELVRRIHPIHSANSSDSFGEFIPFIRRISAGAVADGDQHHAKPFGEFFLFIRHINPIHSANFGRRHG